MWTKASATSSSARVHSTPMAAAPSRSPHRRSRAARRASTVSFEQVGERGFLECETAGDLQARWIDLWDFNPSSTLRYTHPDRMMITHVNQKAVTESVAQALLYGCPLMLRVLPVAIGRQEMLQGELLEAARFFIGVRREMREKRAPGYPARFRATLRLDTPAGKLQVKLFTDGTGVRL